MASWTATGAIVAALSISCSLAVWMAALSCIISCTVHCIFPLRPTAVTATRCAGILVVSSLQPVCMLVHQTNMWCASIGMACGAVCCILQEGDWERVLAAGGHCVVFLELTMVEHSSVSSESRSSVASNRSSDAVISHCGRLILHELQQCNVAGQVLLRSCGADCWQHLGQQQLYQQRQFMMPVIGSSARVSDPSTLHRVQQAQGTALLVCAYSSLL